MGWSMFTVWYCKGGDCSVNQSSSVSGGDGIHTAASTVSSHALPPTASLHTLLRLQTCHFFLVEARILLLGTRSSSTSGAITSVSYQLILAAQLSLRRSQPSHACCITADLIDPAAPAVTLRSPPPTGSGPLLLSTFTTPIKNNLLLQVYIKPSIWFTRHHFSQHHQINMATQAETIIIDLESDAETDASIRSSSAGLVDDGIFVDDNSGQ